MDRRRPWLLIVLASLLVGIPTSVEVQAAGDWGTCVMAHAYTTEAVQRLVANGVKTSRSSGGPTTRWR